MINKLGTKIPLKISYTCINSKSSKKRPRDHIAHLSNIDHNSNQSSQLYEKYQYKYLKKTVFVSVVFVTAIKNRDEFLHNDIANCIIAVKKIKV